MSFQLQFAGRQPEPERALPVHNMVWTCLPVADATKPPADAAILLAIQPAAPTQITRFRAPLHRASQATCETIGPRSQFTINLAADGQRLALQVREATLTPQEADAAAWQRHRSRLGPEGLRTATHGDDAARVCRHLMAERSADIAAARQRQPATATPIQVERTRMHLLTQFLAALDLSCRDQPEYAARAPLLARLERSLLACHALGGRGADCEPAAQW